MILIDVGSTIIKFSRIVDNQAHNHLFLDRNYKQLPEDQVIEELETKFQDFIHTEPIRICSSANGGVRVAVIGYTNKISTIWASRAAENSGANVFFSGTIENFQTTENFDVLVIAGGVDNAPIKLQKKWIELISQRKFNCEKFIFSVNKLLHRHILEFWPEAILTKNILGENLKWQGEELCETLRNSYLGDLVLKKGIKKLVAYSEINIYPTPNIVQIAYEKILNGMINFPIPRPFLLIDIGGATTDVYYGGELISNLSNTTPRPGINRHVFSNIGVFASRNSLLENLRNSYRLDEFLFNTFEIDKSEKIHIDLLDRNFEDFNEEFLSYSAFFLSLFHSTNILSSGHSLNINLCKGIVLTGGASIKLRVEKLEKIISIFSTVKIRVVIDNDYSIWKFGLLNY